MTPINYLYLVQCTGFCLFTICAADYAQAQECYREYGSLDGEGHWVNHFMPIELDRIRTRAWKIKVLGLADVGLPRGVVDDRCFLGLGVVTS